jgi:hypothetical protein
MTSIRTARMIIYFSCMADHVQATIDGRSNRVDAELRSEEQLEYYCKRYPNASFYCSSTIDFPHEYTDDQNIIALCEYIRK